MSFFRGNLIATLFKVIHISGCLTWFCCFFCFFVFCITPIILTARCWTFTSPCPSLLQGVKQSSIQLDPSFPSKELSDGLRVWVSVCVLSHVQLCHFMNCSLPGSSVHEIFQARILEWVAISYSRGSSWPRNWTRVSWISCIGRRILYHYGKEYTG